LIKQLAELNGETLSADAEQTKKLKRDAEKSDTDDAKGKSNGKKKDAPVEDGKEDSLLDKIVDAFRPKNSD